MIIDITDILGQDGASIALDLSETAEHLDADTEGIVFEGPVKFSGRLENTAGVIELHGMLEMRYTIKCSRCLKDISNEEIISIREDFLSDGSGVEDETYTYTGKYVDISSALKDNIILNLPITQVCSEDCRGFCPKCGANLNESECDCGRDETDFRLEILRKLLSDD